jgi:prophage tail gpP-like protein
LGGATRARRLSVGCQYTYCFDKKEGNVTHARKGEKDWYEKTPESHVAESQLKNEKKRRTTSSGQSIKKKTCKFSRRG